MSEIKQQPIGLKAKLGLDVFKHDSEFHISIVPGMAGDMRLRRAILVCPAGLYSLNENKEVELNQDGCLECGTCRLACGPEVLSWYYPNGGAGVQFRFG